MIETYRHRPSSGRVRDYALASVERLVVGSARRKRNGDQGRRAFKLARRAADCIVHLTDAASGRATFGT